LEQREEMGEEERVFEFGMRDGIFGIYAKSAEGERLRK
jgi:hypothetical protein